MCKASVRRSTKILPTSCAQGVHQDVTTIGLPAVGWSVFLGVGNEGTESESIDKGKTSGIDR